VAYLNLANVEFKQVSLLEILGLESKW